MERIARAALVLPLVLGACARHQIGSEVPRRGDEIVVCGRYFHTGAPVVLWTDPGGYDAYRVERRFVPLERASWEATQAENKDLPPARYNLRNPQGGVTGEATLSPEDLERIRAGGWDLPTLERIVDQFVIHYDVAGTSRQCFKVLHDMRGLSVHFMIDLDGTIYQTLDVKERAWHATTSNHRSVGVEIANIGAYPAGKPSPLDAWYERDATGTRVKLPDWMSDGGMRTKGFVARPARPERILGVVQGQALEHYDLTPEQYRSLARLTATLCTVLPRIRCDYPRGPDGTLVTSKLRDDALASYRGVLGHWHVQENKVDPGPAFDWERVITEARRFVGCSEGPTR
jgi:N-acetyl-anhydromuramyl-L-alanine amidase AmpD